MPDIRLRRRHALGLEEACRHAEAVARELEEEHPRLVQRVDWNAEGTAAEVSGRGFRARLALSADEVSVEVDLGLLAKAFRGRLEGELEARLDEHFG